MTPRQRILARHALGLPNKRRMGYQNRYFIRSTKDYPYKEWLKMVDAGEAVTNFVMYEKVQRFSLTEKGALLALDPDETLDPEDFPGYEKNKTHKT